MMRRKGQTYTTTALLVCLSLLLATLLFAANVGVARAASISGNAQDADTGVSAAQIEPPADDLGDNDPDDDEDPTAVTLRSVSVGSGIVTLAWITFIGFAALILLLALFHRASNRHAPIS